MTTAFRAIVFAAALLALESAGLGQENGGAPSRSLAAAPIPGVLDPTTHVFRPAAFRKFAASPNADAATPPLSGIVVVEVLFDTRGTSGDCDIVLSFGNILGNQFLSDYSVKTFVVTFGEEKSARIGVRFAYTPRGADPKQQAKIDCTHFDYRTATTYTTSFTSPAQAIGTTVSYTFHL